MNDGLGIMNLISVVLCEYSVSLCVIFYCTEFHRGGTELQGEDG
jgi:hypothetical protein